MSHEAVCGDKDRLVSYLYDECDQSERAWMDAHLAACDECASELNGLGGVRRELRRWGPPETMLGFQIGRVPETVPPSGTSSAGTSSAGTSSAGTSSAGTSSASTSSFRTSSFLWPPPIWAQFAAAAILVCAVAAGLARVEVRYGSDGLVVRTGWGAAAVPAVSASAPAAAAVSQTDLAALERRLREEFHGSGESASNAMPAAASGAPDRVDLLRRVRALVEESEQKQQHELAVRIAAVLRDVEVQRRTDLARISDGFGQIEGRTGAAVSEQRELLNYLVRVSQRPK